MDFSRFFRKIIWIVTATGKRMAILSYPFRQRFVMWITGAFILSLLTIIGIILHIKGLPPEDFPINTELVIPEGTSVKEIAHILKEEGFIRSEGMFRFGVTVRGVAESLQAGSYIFPGPRSVREIITSLAAGLDSNSVIITVPEGYRIEKIDKTVSQKLWGITPGSFALHAEAYEGYLFPESYKVPTTYSAKDLVDLMRRTFDERTVEIKKLAEAKGIPFEDVVIMASILEREGRGRESMEMISGILWKRIKIGMPLQTDATLEYYIGRGSADLTLIDLASDSPFNTYKHKGLPPKPIANPGLIALKAALNPRESPYLFYLTDHSGVFHYATTYDQHKANKAIYLD